MIQLSNELQGLKNGLLEMWSLVINQVARARDALENFDKDTAREIKANEKQVDAFELGIDMECEKALALYNPVANDLRFVMAVLKINYNLERIGDYANGIAKTIINSCKPFDKEILDKTKLLELFSIALTMLSDALQAFDTENNQLAGNIFRHDEPINIINKNANLIIEEFIKSKPDDIQDHLNVLTLIRRLERIGDQSKNIAEEIIFYIEAKIIRHQKKKKNKS